MIDEIRITSEFWQTEGSRRKKASYLRSDLLLSRPLVRARNAPFCSYDKKKGVQTLP